MMAAHRPTLDAAMTAALDILILEDSDDDRLLLERALRRSGLQAEVTWADCRSDFVRALEAGRPDAIVADCHLPDIDAEGALDIVARVRPGAPVVLVTGGLTDERAAELLQSGAQDYVLKDRLARLGPAILAAIERAGAQAKRCQDATRLKEALMGTIEAIARTVEKRDPYTAGHQARVADLSVAIAREAGLPEERIEGLRLGAMIHDIGKVYLPAEILSRPGKLTALEFEMVKEHAQVGFDIVKDITLPWPVAQMILQHHERLDGSGYPNRLKGDEILVEARVIAVADVVEAMASHRPYRPGLGLAAALAEITAKRGTHFDARAVDACVRVVERDPTIVIPGLLQAA
jgi:putative two-component system response regulator